MHGYVHLFRCAVIGIGLLASPLALRAASVEDNIRAIKSVDKEGKNHADAIRAVKELLQAPAATLPTLLKSFQGANPLAVNWLRGVIDTIADHELKKSGKLPATALEEFVKDTKQTPEARRLAYEWLVKVDATAPDRLIPGMLHDASPEFRRDAVDRLITQATKSHEANDKAKETALLHEALSGASDDDQVKAIVKPLRELGETVDLQKHFGFLTQWHLIGPFDNVGLKGFDTVYPPEKERKLESQVSRQVR